MFDACNDTVEGKQTGVALIEMGNGVSSILVDLRKRRCGPDKVDRIIASECQAHPEFVDKEQVLTVERRNGGFFHDAPRNIDNPRWLAGSGERTLQLANVPRRSQYSTALIGALKMSNSTAFGPPRPAA